MNIVALLKSLNPKAWIVASLKKLAVYEVQKEGDRLQAELRDRVAKEGPGAINRTIDESQRRIIIAVKTKGPTWAFLDPIREKIVSAVQGFGDKLQERIKKEVEAYGPTAVDVAFDAVQRELIEKLQAIQL